MDYPPAETCFSYHYRPAKHDFCDFFVIHYPITTTLSAGDIRKKEKCFWVSERELQSRDPKGQIYHPSGEFWTQTRGTLAIEVANASKQQTEQVMKTYAQDQLGNYSEVCRLA